MMEWTAIVQEHFQDDPTLEILDLGTGGGHHLFHLFHQCPNLRSGLAVDLSEEMLSRVDSILPQVETRQGDMTSLKFGRSFPLICVHDSFCYLAAEKQIQDLFSNIKEHLTHDGLAFVKLDAVKDSFAGPYRYLTSFEDEDYQLTLTHYEWDPNNRDTWIEVVYLFLEQRGSELVTREERHRLGLFHQSDLLKMARSVDLEGEILPLQRWDEDRENLLLLLRHKDSHNSN